MSEPGAQELAAAEAAIEDYRRVIRSLHDSGQPGADLILAAKEEGVLPWVRVVSVAGDVCYYAVGVLGITISASSPASYQHRYLWAHVNDYAHIRDMNVDAARRLAEDTPAIADTVQKYFADLTSQVIA